MLQWLTVVLRLCNTAHILANAAVIDSGVEVMQHSTYTNAAVIDSGVEITQHNIY